MEEIESRVRQKIRRTKVQQAVLATIAMAGVISIAVVAPNTLHLLKPLITDKKSLSDRTRSTRSAFSRLLKAGYIRLEPTPKGRMVRLTAKGLQALAPFSRPGVKLKKPKKWDGKWRILTFDIKEARRSTRDNMRRMLMHIGFFPLQRSVWVYPYDCEDIIILLKADFKIGKDVIYIIADHIENDAALKKFFDLRS
jgi:DNA-binding transcriptional regulator PaaX